MWLIERPEPSSSYSLSSLLSPSVTDVVLFWTSVEESSYCPFFCHGGCVKSSWFKAVWQKALREKTAYYEMRVCVPVWTCCYRQQKCEAVGWCSQTFAGLLDIPQQLTLQKIKLVFSVLPLLSYQTSIETCASARPRRLSVSRDVHTGSVFFALGGFDSKSAG